MNTFLAPTTARQAARYRLNREIEYLRTAATMAETHGLAGVAGELRDLAARVRDGTVAPAHTAHTNITRVDRHGTSTQLTKTR